MDVSVVLTTVGTEDEANTMAEELVQRRHTCCVNIITKVRSVYRWKGKICRDDEYMLLIKSLDGEVEALENAVRELHSYELPEILRFNIDHVDERFLQWITGCLDKSAAFSDEKDDGLAVDPEDSNF
jgi:periplasmic divalent cation tolerance protein